MNKGWLAAAAVLLLAGSAQAQATLQVQTPPMRVATGGGQSSCGVLANHTYAVQWRGQAPGGTAGEYVLTGVWFFRGDGTGHVSEIVAGPPASGGARSYDFICAASASAPITSVMQLTLGQGSQTTPNVAGINYVAISGGGAGFAITNTGQGNTRIAGWGERQ